MTQLNTAAPAMLIHSEYRNLSMQISKDEMLHNPDLQKEFPLHRGASQDRAGAVGRLILQPDWKSLPKEGQAPLQGSSICSRMNLFSIQLYSLVFISKQKYTRMLFCFLLEELQSCHKLRDGYDEDEGFRSLISSLKAAEIF